MKDTDWTERGNDDFVPQGKILCWRADGLDRHSYLYTPSDVALSWDDAPEGVNAAIGNARGGYYYVKVEVTGRINTPVFDHVGAPLGKRCKITFTSVDFDEGTQFADTAKGWIRDVERR